MNLGQAEYLDHCNRLKGIYKSKGNIKGGVWLDNCHDKVRQSWVNNYRYQSTGKPKIPISNL